MADRVGQQLGNYQLIRLLGEGGFAEVYLGEHIHLGAQAAIKVLHTQLTSDDVDKFRTEARIIAHLIHPHIVRVLEFGVEGKTPFLVMDYAPNGTLRQRHPKGIALPLPLIVSYVKQIADALQYAHDEKLIHRDVKPENMLLGRRDEILLSDFGIALVAQSSRYQRIQDMAGTMAYMAPEQIQGKPRPASDQYSLGIVVYEWISGDRPFYGSLTEIVGQHLFAAPPPLREKVPTLPLDVENVVMVALMKDPKQRFLNVQTFADALEQASQSEQATFVKPPSHLSPLPLAPAPKSPVVSSPSGSTQHDGVLSPDGTKHTSQEAATEQAQRTSSSQIAAKQRLIPPSKQSFAPHEAAITSKSRSSPAKFYTLINRWVVIALVIWIILGVTYQVIFTNHFPWFEALLEPFGIPSIETFNREVLAPPSFALSISLIVLATFTWIMTHVPKLRSFPAKYYTLMNRHVVIALVILGSTYTLFTILLGSLILRYSSTALLILLTILVTFTWIMTNARLTKRHMHPGEFIVLAVVIVGIIFAQFLFGVPYIFGSSSIILYASLVSLTAFTVVVKIAQLTQHYTLLGLNAAMGVLMVVLTFSQFASSEYFFLSYILLISLTVLAVIGVISKLTKHQALIGGLVAVILSLLGIALMRISQSWYTGSLLTIPAAFTLIVASPQLRKRYVLVGGLAILVFFMLALIDPKGWSEGWYISLFDSTIFLTALAIMETTGQFSSSE